MNFERLTLPILLLLFVSCKTSIPVDLLTTEELKVVKTSQNTYAHISYLETESYGKVACNGMVFISQNEAVIFDTPANEAASLELIRWIEEDLACRIIGIVVTHFHLDCLGGLEEMHKKSIPSYANNATIRLAKQNAYTVPLNGFESSLKLEVGNKSVVNSFLGEGHTVDNIVSFVPSEKVLFGGCLVKSLGSGKGNLEDANVSEWSNTVKKVKETFSDVKVVIPGHGSIGDKSLLDYTIEKFNVE